MTLDQILKAEWTESPPPVEANDVECATEITIPWIFQDRTRQRVLSAVDIGGEIYVIARDRDDTITDCWFVHQMEEAK